MLLTPPCKGTTILGLDPGKLERLPQPIFLFPFLELAEDYDEDDDLGFLQGVNLSTLALYLSVDGVARIFII